MKDAKLLVEKWKPVIEAQKAGPVPASRREALAILLENQASYLAEAGLSGDIARFEPVIIPVVRRVFPNLVANELVAVQPMTGPSGLAFAMRYRYTNTSANPIEPAKNAVVLTLADATGFTPGTQVATAGDAFTGTVRYVEGNNVLVEVANGTVNAGDSIDDAATYSAEATTVSAVYTNEAGFNFIFKNYSGAYVTAAGEKLSTDMNEIGLTIESTPITAKTRALKAKYSIEMAQDLRAVHNIDVETELATILSYEIQQEIDREIIDVIEAQARLNPTIVYDYAAVDGRWEQEKFRNLYTRIVKAANQIGQATRRGAGNFIVVSADVATVIESMDSFASSPVNGTAVDSTALGVSVIGTLGGRFKVVKDMFRTSNDIIVGYKGASLPDTGVVYCPYVPLNMMNAVGEEDFQPRIGFKTRYALATDFGTEDSRDYYRVVEVKNLPL